jgi:hypothetical protein
VSAMLLFMLVFLKVSVVRQIGSLSAVASVAVLVHGQVPDGLPDDCQFSDRIGVACVCIVRMQVARLGPW